MAIQEGCQIHHRYHHNLVPRNHRKCQIQMCFDLEELNLEVVMMGLEMRVGKIMRNGGGSCVDGGAIDSLDKRGT